MATKKKNDEPDEVVEDVAPVPPESYSKPQSGRPNKVAGPNTTFASRAKANAKVIRNVEAEGK